MWKKMCSKLCWDVTQKNASIYQRERKNAKLAAWWDRAVDIIPKEGGKGTAIEQVLAHYKFSKEEAIAFGEWEEMIVDD